MAVVQGTTPNYGVTDTTVPVATKKADVSKETFLQLLVSQIKHQDPLNPADGTQFITQLAQFSELEQMVSIRGEVEKLRSSLEAQAKTSETTGDTKNV